MSPARLPKALRDTIIGLGVGTLAGLGSYLFLAALEWTTATRETKEWTLWCLPLVGLVVGYVNLRFGGKAVRGTNLVLDEFHEPTVGPPRRMAPLVFGGTVITQLAGGSSGREGAAVQIAASLTSWFRRPVAEDDRRAIMVAAMAGGFGSVFGVPAAGTLFALEVPASGRIGGRHVSAALVASFVGDRVAVALGATHETRPDVRLFMDWLMAGRIVVAAVAFGCCAVVFIELTNLIRRRMIRHIRFSPLRLVIGGTAIVVMTAVVQTRDYLGLSLPLLDAAVVGGSVVGFAFALKLVFTAVTIGSGFPGGEVTPLLCIGACLGSTLAGPLGIPRGSLAALGMIAVFAAASNTPVACTVMAAELFGGQGIFAFLLVTVVATVVSGNRSIYGSQRAGQPQRDPNAGTGLSMHELDLVRQTQVLAWSQRWFGKVF